MYLWVWICAALSPNTVEIHWIVCLHPLSASFSPPFCQFFFYILLRKFNPFAFNLTADKERFLFSHFLLISFFCLFVWDTVLWSSGWVIAYWSPPAEPWIATFMNDHHTVLGQWFFFWDFFHCFLLCAKR